MFQRIKARRQTWKSRQALALSVLLVMGLLAPRLMGDDRELLRENGADPYLFLLLDTSMSMSLAIDGSFVEANGNDPRSRIYQAREVLYELLKDLPGIQYGFATFNQDQLHVRSKHWLYYIEDPDSTPANSTPLANLQAALGYPEEEPDNEIEITVVSPSGVSDIDVDIDGDLMTFGRGIGDPEFSVPGGTCAAPLQISDADERRKINRYAKLGIDSNTDTEIWVEADIPGNDPTYRLTFKNATPATLLGAAKIQVTIKADRVSSCGSGSPTFSSTVEETLVLGRWRDFLMTDDSGGSVTYSNSGAGAGNKSATEETGGFWDWRDADGGFSCGDAKPFSGGGWEGNYDTGQPFTTNPAYEASIIPAGKADLVDRQCVTSAGVVDCDLLLGTTDYNATINRRELDRGDMLPFHWDFDHKNEMLTRLNPNHGVSPSNPQYGAAPYFEDVPDPVTGRLELKSAYRGANPGDPPRYSPIVPAGISPISDAILDFRCWYVGPNNKCGRGGLDQIYTEGFMQLLEDNDPSAFQCRQPFLIVISDMSSNCPGNSPVAQVAGMNTDTRTGNNRSSGVSTWVLNVGTGKANALANAGKGQEIEVSSKDQLRSELIDILGVIQETTRSFSSAAVPSVQADVQDQIYLTQFTPRQEAAVWEGHVHSFAKPLPVVPLDPANPGAGSTPDTSHANHNWDAAVEMLTQAPVASTLSYPYDRLELKLGSANTQRRLIYAIQDSDPTTDADGDGRADNDVDIKVPRSRFLFGPAEGTPPSNMDLNDVRKDLWMGMGVIVDETFTFTSNPNGSDLDTKHPTETAKAHNVFAKTFAIKQVQPRDGNGNPDGPIVNYVLGDIFHATPLLVGNPTNGRYLSRSEPGEDFEGYEQFFDVQQRRRKVLFVASDDGQLHAFDAGRFQGNIQDREGEFDVGTGKEIFAYTPREVLPTLTNLAEPPLDHDWGVDGNPEAADVKIDPRHGGRGSTDEPNFAQREWRTVVVGGLRRGGRSFYALDVTRPDTMVKEEVNFQGQSDFLLGYKPGSPASVVPTCSAPTSSGPALDQCDPEGYPRILWEFTDPDMGQSWSNPNLGAIRVLENGTPVIKYVAIFGGGLEPGSTTLGHKMYIVDMETGKMLYKRNLVGAAAAPPAAIDTDQDGVLDRIYQGTVGGLMYRIDLSEPKEIARGTTGANSCPITPPVGSSDSCCASDGGQVHGCVIDPAWEPFQIFDTVTTESDPVLGSLVVRRPIYFAPSVIFVAQLNSYALAFGTGNRENLWSRAPIGGNRSYLIVDDSELLNPADLPRVEGDFDDVTDNQIGTDTDLLTDPAEGSRGWFIKLGVVPDADLTLNVTNEMMVTPVTGISGLTVLSTFIPDTTSTTVGSGQNQETRCARRGISRVYTQFASNGGGISKPATPGDPVVICETPPCDDRKPESVSDLVSEPFLEEAAQPCPGTEGMADVLKEQLFPANCHFGKYRWNLSTMRADTGVECLAQIPVCIVEKNWKDY